MYLNLFKVGHFLLLLPLICTLKLNSEIHPYGEKLVIILNVVWEVLQCLICLCAKWK